MLKYVCKNCDDLICDTSICPVCGNRTELVESTIFWSKEYNAPSFDEVCFSNGEKCKSIGSDIRPVFAEERLLLELLQGIPMAWAGKSVWNTGANRYVVDGKKITLPFTDMAKTADADEIINKLIEYKEENQFYVDNFYEQEYIKKFIEINKVRLNTISQEAFDYVRRKANGWQIDEMFVSFSGGKDSTVTSHIAMNALNMQSLIHIYGDTTLEYPTSETYLQRFKNANKETPVLVAKNKDQDFDNLCEVIGPPSRVMRWCCTVFKTGAITKKIETTFRNKNKILSFQGIRRNESKSRNKYDRDSTSSKITKQQVASPIIDWIDFDVWLYILSNNLDFNDAYKQGFARVGCWCCPNNSTWSAFLSKIYMNEQYVKFYNILYTFAKKVGKEDWKEYIDDGKWKARQGGNGLAISDNAVISFAPCALEENAYNFTLSRPIDERLYELFKPCGILDFELGNKRLGEVFVLDKKSNEPILKLTGKVDKNQLKVSVLKQTATFKNKTISEMLIKNQITKFQTCIGCSACQSVCRFNALKVVNLEKGNVSNDTISYKIDANKCVGCLECVKHFDSGCYMKKVLRTKKGQ